MATVLTTTYASSAAVYTSTGLDSLASDTNFLTGLESAVIDNTTNMYVDAMLAGRFKANNTAPTAGQIRVYVGALLDDTIYPDVFDGTEGSETVTSAVIRDSILVMAMKPIVTDTTSNRVYEFRKVSVAQLFGGVMPKKWFTFVTHSMVQTLNATASNGGQLWYSGIKYTST